MSFLDFLVFDYVLELLDRSGKMLGFILIKLRPNLATGRRKTWKAQIMKPFPFFELPNMYVYTVTEYDKKCVNFTQGLDFSKV